MAALPARGIVSAAPAPGWDCHVHVFDSRLPVLPGHYQPATASLASIEKLARSHGFGQLVLVQPSVYGFDNTLLCEALQASGGRHRGVAVIEPSTAMATLKAWHHIGVRGVRFNCVSPVQQNASGAAMGSGVTNSVEQAFRQLHPSLQTLGWHTEWFVNASDLPAVAQLHSSQTNPVPAVLDHLAGMGAPLALQSPASQTAWAALEQLAQNGAWLKLSGWYRLQAAQPPYAEIDANLTRAAALFGNRLVWGSDWPHTFFQPPMAMPAYAELWKPVVRCLGKKRAAQICSDAAWRLYR